MTEKRTSSARARSGFTLAELLIVTGIVAILVAVSIPIMSGQVQKAKEVRAKRGEDSMHGALDVST